MAMPTRGPQTPDGQGMAQAMGGTRSNGNKPSPIPQPSVLPAQPYLPNNGIQFTPRPAAAPQAPAPAPQQQAPHPMAAMGSQMQAQASAPPAQGSFPQANNFGTTNFIGNPGLQQYGYTAATGQKSDGTEDKYMAQQQAQIQRTQGNLAGAVAGYGDQERQKFGIQVGNLLGQQNSIGGLRSGGVEQGVADFGDQFGREVGDYAAQTAVQGQQQGLEANDQIQSSVAAVQARKDAKHKALMGAIGSGLGILGSVI